MIMSANSSSSYKLRSLVTLLHHYYRVRINGESSQLQGIVPATRIGYGGSISPGLRFISSGDYRIPKTTDQVKNEANIVPPEEPAPSKPSLFAWTKWILGSIISIFLPFWKDKWDNFRRIEGIAEKLPENSLLKEAAVAVENASAVAAKEAQFTSNLIHKVEYVERDLKDLKTMVEPVIEKIEELESSKK
ncbi:uncharacterized protein [Nicotiana sylvestris]|uniref:uncharacterized protein isoform X2 n=1 Tax=Nicotiana sylvestris TaxID=4096 RepID=UPI00388CC084